MTSRFGGGVAWQGQAAGGGGAGAAGEGGAGSSAEAHLDLEARARSDPEFVAHEQVATAGEAHAQQLAGGGGVPELGASLASQGESFLRVHWVAVPKAMRARRVNREGGAPSIPVSTTAAIARCCCCLGVAEAVLAPAPVPCVRVRVWCLHRDVCMAWHVAAGGWRSESKQQLVEEQLEHCSDEHERLVLEEKLAAQMEAAEEVWERIAIVVHMPACMHVLCTHTYGAPPRPAWRAAHVQRQMDLDLMPPPAPPGQTTS
jgi:hypothetical protein